ncbi:helix-turn-helix transcriptional regulator [Actinophytocola sp.]|uniref:helix-turn-helix transcriptional regulator n=1 Tax=Actinophytocola sp. TaxID=1872138 RepID=UPI002D5F9764|nr:LuxR C-terminal-related transcriptional regulator [Actinophytocola sp.]HYQ64453.1 LuxR C-terminal-related transcriptional regulator [Actinophytocola sp.]
MISLHAVLSVVWKGTRRMPVLGRSAEKELLTRVIEGVRTGRGGAAVVLGRVGIGKTALIDDVAGGFTDVTTVRVSQADFDVDSPYSGLRGVITPFSHVLGELPEPRSRAMRLALGLRAGGFADPFLLGQATLAVLRSVASERPLLCVVDDAHLLDPVSLRSLTFAGRRLSGERCALVFGARPVAGPPDWFDGLSALPLGPLGEEECLRLLTSVAGGIGNVATARVLAAAEGNPGAIVEYGRALTEWRGTDGLRVPDPLPITARTRAEYVRAKDDLSRAARWGVLVASAEPAGDVDLVVRAVRHLGVDPADVDLAVSGFFDLAGKVRFPHPLTRSIVYHSASSRERTLVHQALGAVVDTAVGPERRVWHRAAVLAEPDERIAAELAGAAASARARGGHAAESTFLTRAAELSPDDRSRAGRLVAAARAAQLSGDNELSIALLDRASAPRTSAYDSAYDRQDADRIRGAALTWSARASQAATLLGAAVEECRVRDEGLARRLWLQAVNAALLASREPGDPALDRLVAVARSMPSRAGRGRGTDEDVMHALAMRLSRGRVDTAGPLRRALLPDAAGETAQFGREPVLTTLLSLEIWDLAAGRRALARMAAACRRDGALTGLYATLVALAHQEALAGRFHVAGEHCREAREVAARLGIPANRAGLAALVPDALRGRARQVRATAFAMRDGLTAEGYGLGAATCVLALAMVDVAQGRYRRALVHARDVHELDPPGVGNLVLPYLVESAVRVGDRALAAAGLRRLEERVEAAGSFWGQGVLDRCRALVASGSAAEELFATAAGRLDPDSLPLEHARTHLIWGEWLRREGRGEDSIAHLRTAYRMFVSMDSLPLAQRCARESRAAGARTGEFGTWPSAGLTGQEKTIAELAARGMTNEAIASTLFVSVNTIAYHLKKIYRKLGVSSRRKLSVLLSLGVEPEA